MLCPGTKTPHATEQLGLTLQLLSHIRKSTCNSERSYTTQLRFNAANQSIDNVSIIELVSKLSERVQSAWLSAQQLVGAVALVATSPVGQRAFISWLSRPHYI